MKNIIYLLLLVTIIIASSISCGDHERFCEVGESFEFRPYSSILSYFDFYKRGDQIVFESKNRFDTLFVLSNMFDTTRIECFNYINKKIHVYSHSIFNSDTAVIIMGISDNNRTSFIAITDANEKSRVGITYVIEKNNFRTLLKNSLGLIHFILKTKLYLDVIKVRSIDNNSSSSFFYFTPNSGIIKWENKTDTFTIKN